MHPRRRTEAVSKMESENNNTPSHKKGKKTRRVKANNFPFLSPTTREESFGRKGVRLSLFFIPLSLYYYYTTLLLLLLIPTENRRGRMGEKEPEEGDGERGKKFLLGKSRRTGIFLPSKGERMPPATLSPSFPGNQMKMSSVVLVYLERDSELMWSEEEGDSIRFIILTENEWLLQGLLLFGIDSTILLRRSGGGRGDRPIKGLGREGAVSWFVKIGGKGR